ncbi:unnamed protein product [Urochloa humidicola]
MGKGTAEPEDAVLLHGNLDIRIVEAKCLPNMDIMSERMRRCFSACGGAGSCGGDRPSAPPDGGLRRGGAGGSSKSMKKKKIITSDPYVSVCLAGATVAQTRVIPNSENPRWEEHFRVEVAHAVARVDFHVKDNDVFGAQLIGVASVPVANIAAGELVAGWFPVEGHWTSNSARPAPELQLSIRYKPIGDNPLYKDGVGAGPLSCGVASVPVANIAAGELVAGWFPVKGHWTSNSARPAPELQLSIRYKPIGDNPLYKDGVGAGPLSCGVPNAYFPLRRGGRVTLYQEFRTPMSPMAIRPRSRLMVAGSTSMASVGRTFVTPSSKLTIWFRKSQFLTIQL